MHAKLWLTGAFVAIGAGALAAGPAVAVEEFEIEEQEVEEGAVEIFYQGDHHFGFPRRSFLGHADFPAEPDEFSVDDNEVPKQRHYFEFGMGLTDWFGFAIAAEFEKERVDDPKGFEDRETFQQLKFTGIEGEFKLVLLPLKGNGIGLTWFTEVGTGTESSEGSSVGIGPIVKLAQGPFSATFNPIFTKHYGGDHVEEDNEDGDRVVEERFDDRWDFNYGWQIAYEMSSKLTLTVEGYGSVERLGSSGRASHTTTEERLAIEEVGGSVNSLLGDHDQHYVGPVVYYKLDTGAGAMAAKDDDDGGGVTLGLGVLFGLNENSNDAALKWSVEAEF